MKKYKSTSKGERIVLGQRLHEARCYLGFSQDDVAKALDMHRPTVSNIEKGVRKVDSLELVKLAKLYGKPVSYFIGDVLTTTPADLVDVFGDLSLFGKDDIAELVSFADFLRHRKLAKASSVASAIPAE